MFFLEDMLRSQRMDLTIIVWAFVGGFFLAILGAGAIYFKTHSISAKQLSRDFILGTLITGFLYPVLPESVDQIESVLPVSSLTAESIKGLDPRVQVGPANF